MKTSGKSKRLKLNDIVRFFILNQDTLWLQVPAAISYSNSPLSSHAISKKVNIILFIADHSIDINKSNTIPESAKDLLKQMSKMIEELFLENEKSYSRIEVIEPKFINLGVIKNIKHNNKMINSFVGEINQNIALTPAMTHEQLTRAINIGRQTAQAIKRSETELFIARELNPANILSATALSCALLNIPSKYLIEIDAEQIKLIKQALLLHKNQLNSAMEILRHLGSFEIATLTGSYLCCAHMGLPIWVNSFATSVAALITAIICPQAEKWFVYSKVSTNTIHTTVIESLKSKKLFSLM